MIFIMEYNWTLIKKNWIEKSVESICDNIHQFYVKSSHKNIMNTEWFTRMNQHTEFFFWERLAQMQTGC